MTKKNIIIITGPTASGKSKIALELSQELNTEIISADSRQVYKYLDIGTAKPTKEELNQVKHHIVDFLNPDEYFSAGEFAKDANLIIDDLIQQSKIPIICGGTGLYIKAITEGLFDDEGGTKYLETRTNLNQRFEQNGIEILFEELQKVDLISANKYSDKNPRRIIRALEYYLVNNEPFSSRHNGNLESKYDFRFYAINISREELYNKINQRTLQMWDNGLIEETAKVLNMQYTKELNSLNTVGYKEAIQFLESAISKDKAIELHQMNTRRYAKRQLTWIKNQIVQIKYINSFEEILNDIN